MTESFGMMDGAFFVGKNEILKWLNGTYKLNINKIEQACTGAVYCQIIDSVHPGKVKMHRVNWKAKLEHEYLNNYKILQQAFTDCKIAKHIEVSKLSKGKYQDNLEFLQWLKKYVDDRKISNDYDALLRRGGNELEIANENLINNLSKKRDNSKPQSSSNNIIKSVKSEKNLLSNNSTNNSKSINNIKIEKEIVDKLENERKYLLIICIGSSNTDLNENQLLKTNGKNLIDPNIEKQIKIETNDNKVNKFAYNGNDIDEARESVRQYYQERIDIVNDEVSKLKLEVNTLKISISEIGRERDFYYSKLRDFEIITVKNPNIDKDELISLMKTILFSDKEIELQFDENNKVDVKII